jgi:hypothetical protein
MYVIHILVNWLEYHGHYQIIERRVDTVEDFRNAPGEDWELIV